jgi:hypothetical protein
VGEWLTADQLAVVVLKVAELRLNVLVGDGLETAREDDAVDDEARMPSSLALRRRSS